MRGIQKRSEVFSNNSRHSNWHGRPASELAAPIEIYVSENPEVTSLADEQAFEQVLKKEAIRKQQELEADPKCQKPSARPREETMVFAGDMESFEEWLSRQPREEVEEIEVTPAA